MQHLQEDRLAAQFAQLQGGDGHAAGLARKQGDDPAGRGLVVAIQTGEAVDLTRVAHLERAFEGCQIGLAELRDIVGFQGQLDRFPRVEPGAIDAGHQGGGLRPLGQHGQGCTDAEGTEATHRILS